MFHGNTLRFPISSWFILAVSILVTFLSVADGTIAQAAVDPPWGTPQQVTTVPTTNWPYTTKANGGAASIIDTTGVLHTVYKYTQDDMSGIVNSTGPRVIKQEILYTKKTGTTWSNPQTVYTQTTNTDSNLTGYYAFANLRIAIDSNSRPHVVWTSGQSGGCPTFNTAEVYYSYFNGSSWSAPLNVTNNSTWSMQPDIAVDNSNNVHIIWSDGKTFDASCGSTGVTSIYHRMKSSGGIWSTATPVVGNTVYGTYGAIAKGSGNTLHLVFKTNNGSINLLNYSSWNGTQWSTPTQFGHSALDYEYIDMATDGSNNPHVTYTFADGSYSQRRLGYTRWNGTAWTAPETYSSTADGYIKMPTVSIDGSNNPNLVWYDDATNLIQHRKKTTLGWTNITTISDQHSATQQSAINASVGSNNLLHVTWDSTINTTSGQQEVFCNSGDVSGLTAPYNLLTVTKGGMGTGLVTASSGTLSWSGQTGTATYSTVTNVTLNALADADSIFTGWGGACQGMGICTVTMDQARSVTASFTKLTADMLASMGRPLPDTGQTKCYNNVNGVEITCPAPDQAFYGQDGNYNINPPSYTKLDSSGSALPDNATSWVMVRDNVTGLIWENKTADGSIHDGSKTFTWCDRNTATNGGNEGACGAGTGNAATDTAAFIKNLNDSVFGGFSDWRIPTPYELAAIGDRSQSVPLINTDWFPNTLRAYYWASIAAGPDYAWGVTFDYLRVDGGHVLRGAKSGPGLVRAVRGGQSGSPGSLADNGDGTVTDRDTGLMWQQVAADGKNWQAALAYAEALTLAGYDDWRLPNIHELQTIIDYRRGGPFIDSTAFPGTLSHTYWSSSTDVNTPGFAWCAYFLDGRVVYNQKVFGYGARAVRGGQSRLLGNLVIFAPAQAAQLQTGATQAITWDTAGISGNVKITLSRQGGKTGTFTEVIADGVPNNGSYNWTVTGPSSVNSVLKIEPLSDLAKTTTAGLFSIVVLPELVVSKSGTGSGVITSNPAGISCGSDCSEAYFSETSITLTAAPDSGSTFTGWSGGSCSGTGSCVVTMNAATSINATFAADNPFFTGIQAIPTSGAMDWKSFMINGETYLAVANSYNGSSENVDSKIYKWNGTSFQEVQSIPTNGTQGLETFVIDGNTYLAVANTNNGSTYVINSKIYKWNGTRFDDFQAIQTDGAYWWHSFVMGGVPYLAVANRNSNSKIYKWNGTSFIEFQSIPTKQAYAWKSLVIDGTTYLAVANHYDDSTQYNTDSKIYKWNGTQFVEFQTIPTKGARDWESFAIAGTTYLAVANGMETSPYSLDTDSKIYKWNGSSFELFQTIPTHGAHDWDSFVIGGIPYLALANQAAGVNQFNNSTVKIYQWNGTSFTETQSIAAQGAVQSQSFFIGGKPYLAVANAYNGSSFQINSKIYSWNVPTSIYVLSVSKSGSGSGSITASVGSLSWTGNTGTASYTSGTSVTLTATPNTGAIFENWSGCDSTSGTACTVAMTAAKGVTATFTADNTPPDTTITAQPTTPTNSTSASFSFTSTEANSTFHCQLDAGGYATCTSPKSYTGLPAGNHTFYVKATDAAGNTDATPASFTWEVDVTNPNTTVFTNTTSATNNVKPTWTWVSGGNGGSGTYRYKLDSSDFTTGTTETTATSFTPATNLPEGSHILYIQERDAAGNWSISSSFTIIVDTIGPIGSAPPSGMVLIPAGSFQMGDAIDSVSIGMPTHTVTLSAFYLEKYEVTKALWDEVKTWAMSNGYAFDNAGAGTAANHPVQTVSWYDVVKWLNARSEKEGRTPAYYTDAVQTTIYRTGQVDVAIEAVKWSASGYRLPTEAEWEYAARAGTTVRYYTGDCISSDTQANYNGTSSYYGCPTGQNRQATTVVGSFPANPWGLYDMAGNVWEWTWDWYGSYSAVPVTNPKGPNSGSERVSRGGSWANDARSPRSVDRNFTPLSWVSGTNIGFRSAMGVSTGSPISINSDALATNSTSVTLSLSAADTNGVTHMMVGNDAAFTGRTEETYATGKVWTLSAGDGTKTVYVKFRDAAGNWSQVYSASILLDTTGPTVTANPPAGTYLTAQNVTLACDDGTGSGCEKTFFTTNGTDPTTNSTIYSSAIPIASTTTLRFFAVDKLGNPGPIQSALYTTQGVTMTAGSIQVVKGETRQTTATLTALGGFDSAMNLSYAWQGNAPTNTTVNITPSPITPTSTGVLATVSLTADSATIAGAYTLRITADGGGYSLFKDISVTVAGPLALSTDAAISGVKGQPLAPITATGGIGSPTFSHTGTLPPGMAFNADGTFTGTPTARGTYNFTVQVADADNHTINRGYTVRIYDPAYRHLLLEASSWNVQTNAVSDWIYAKVLNDYDAIVTVAANTTIDLSSSSSTGQFSTDGSTWGGNVISPDILAGASSRRFKYRDATAGTFSITAAGVPGTPNEGWSLGTHDIVVTGPQYTLTVTKAGTGSGTVTSNPTGINCGTDCSEPYNPGTSVVLTAAPDAGKSFAGWSGDCQGSGSCSLTMNGNRNVTATFGPGEAVPADPSGLEVAEITGSSVKLGWNKNPETGVFYNVFRSQTQNGIFYQVNTTPVDDASLAFNRFYYTDKNLKTDTVYYYKIQAKLGTTASNGFSGTVSAKPTEDYEVIMTRTSAIAPRGGTATFNVQLVPKVGFKGTLNILCQELPPSGMTPRFTLNGIKKSAVISDIPLTQPASLVLEIGIGSAVQAKEYSFKLFTQNVYEGGGSTITVPLTLTVAAAGGIFVETTKPTFRKGDPVKIYGSIYPPLAGRTVRVTIAAAGGGTPETREVVSTMNGDFEITNWLSILNIGSYAMNASWRDDTTTLLTSANRTFTVEKGQLSLTCQRDLSIIPIANQDYRIYGKIAPSPASGSAKILLRVTDTNDAIVVPDRVTYADGTGNYQLTAPYFTGDGIWKVKAYWEGDDQHIGEESDFLIVPVGMDYGRAIIVGGGKAEQTNTLWEVTRKLTISAYRDFQRQGFSAEMIYYLLNGEVDIDYDGHMDPVIDKDPPTVADVVETIKIRFRSDLNDKNTLFVYLQGHGTDDGRFKVLGEDQYLTALQLKTALDDIQAETGCTTVLILEACYSGSLIPTLSGPKRVILTSTGSGQVYKTDASGNIAFSRYLFSKLLEGSNLLKAFEFARNTMINMQYPAPLMDDNGDGKPDANDGTLASKTYLIGRPIWGTKPVIGDMIYPSSLQGSANSAPVQVQVIRGDRDIEKVWAQVIAPNADIAGQAGTVTYPEKQLNFNAQTGQYTGTIDGLTFPGVYTLVLFAQDVDKEVSNPKSVYISVAGSGTPGDVNGDTLVNLADAILAQQILSGISPPVGAIRAGYAPFSADVNGDGQIGSSEALYILQTVAGMR